MKKSIVLSVIIIALFSTISFGFIDSKTDIISEDAVYISIHVSFEGEIGDVNNATVNVYDSEGKLVIGGGITGPPNGNGYAVFHIHGLGGGTYIAEATYPGRGPGQTTFYYSGIGSLTKNVSLGPAY